MDEMAVRTNLRAWILARAKVSSPGVLMDETPLLERGILTSIDIVELVLHIESMRGQEVDADALEPEVFTSVNTLWEGFFSPLAAGA